MTTLTWSESLALDHPQMDQTHEEFVALLAACASALPGTDAPLLAAFETLVDHTTAHFAQEDRWMAATGFAPENCHAFQHQAVLQVMQECAKRAREGTDFEPLRLAVDELGSWFPQHAQSMDAGLAQHMASLGFDTHTGQFTLPAAAAAAAEAPAAITGCGSASCG